jgi:hypothetical protein
VAAAGLVAGLSGALAIETPAGGNLRARNAAPPAETFAITEEMFELFSSWFEPPDESERAILISVSAAF